MYESPSHRLPFIAKFLQHYALLKSSAGNATASGGKGPISDIFIHGWVYDLANGEIRDLGVSVGPPGKPIPTPPFPAVANSAARSIDEHHP
jgi:hypothetical protein